MAPQKVRGMAEMMSVRRRQGDGDDDDDDVYVDCAVFGSVNTAFAVGPKPVQTSRTVVAKRSLSMGSSGHGRRCVDHRPMSDVRAPAADHTNQFRPRAYSVLVTSCVCTSTSSLGQVAALSSTNNVGRL